MQTAAPPDRDGLAVRALRSDDLDELVLLHAEVFPNYFLTHLGPGVLRRFYAQFVEMPKNIAYVAESSGKIVGFVTGTLDAPSLQRKFYRRHFIRIAFAVLWGLVSDPIIRRGILSRIFHIRGALAATLTGGVAYVLRHKRQATVGALVTLIWLGLEVEIEIQGGMVVALVLASVSVLVLAYALVSLGSRGAPKAQNSSSVTARVLSLGVKSSRRGGGVADRLVDSYCDAASAIGENVVGLSVLASNSRAIRFYRKSGWITEFETPEAIYFFRGTNSAAPNSSG